MSLATTAIVRAEGVVAELDFDEVFRDNLALVWRTACALGSSDIAEDVAQEVFLVVRRRLAAFEGESVRAWLCGITRNVVRNHARAHGRRARHLAAVAPVDPAPTPDAALELHRAADLLDEFLATLPDEQRDAFTLHEIDGLAAAEIAALAQVPTRTIYSRIRLARAAFERFSSRVAARQRREQR